MCGRYSLIQNEARLRKRFGYKDQLTFGPRYNICPGQDALCRVSAISFRRYFLSQLAKSALPASLSFRSTGRTAKALTPAICSALSRKRPWKLLLD
jgi:putative SOS response-associated peptidase YedK